MSKREWTVLAGIAVAVLVGIALEPEHTTMPGHSHSDATVGNATPAATTVTLAVSGMT